MYEFVRFFTVISILIFYLLFPFLYFSYLFFHVAVSSLGHLQQDVKGSIRAAFAEGTIKNHKVQWKTYFLFCQYFGLRPLPTNCNIMCLYAQFLSRSFQSVQSIKNYISGVKLLHLFLDLEYITESFQLNLLLKGISRLNPHMPRKALPITPDILMDFFRFLDLRKKGDSTFWCLFLFMFFLMARKSNMVPVSAGDFDSEKHLLRRDITLGEDLVVISLKWSKTNQFGDRLLKIPLLHIPDSCLCPVRAYRHMISLIPADATSPAFCLPGSGGFGPILYPELLRVLRSLIKVSGRNPDLFSSHSFRRGGCSWAFKSKVPAELIQIHGDWLSEAYKEYLCFDFETKLSVSARMKAKILKLNTGSAI